MGHPVAYTTNSDAALARSLQEAELEELDAPLPAEQQPRRRRPWFCLLAVLACCILFLVEMAENEWKVQPFVCPASCAGRPCYEDGAACEANPLLGPTTAVMDKLGAKDDVAIFEEGEWWRVVACNWLHVGLIHLLLNMLAVGSLGCALERRFGFWRVGLLYVLSGLFGTLCSVLFLPGVLSLGASASVFGLVGATWADVILNYLARGTTRGAGLCQLLFLTALNLAIGLTPWVDNFMHLGGLVCGLVVGLMLFSKRHVDPRTGKNAYTCVQKEVVFCGVVLFLVLLGGVIAVSVSPEAQEAFRECGSCERLNCVEIDWFTDKPWWSCCFARNGAGTCTIEPANASTVIANCNVTAREPFSVPCHTSDPLCEYSPADVGSVSKLCTRLCSGC